VILVSVEVTGLCYSPTFEECMSSDPSPKLAVGDFIRFTGENIYNADVGEICEILSVEEFPDKEGYSYSFNVKRFYSTSRPSRGYYALYDRHPSQWENVEIANFTKSPLWKLMNGKE
jgi:hypothetical protein